jgi:hypothetical protein
MLGKFIFLIVYVIEIIWRINLKNFHLEKYE